MLYNINMCLFRLAVNFPEIRKKCPTSASFARSTFQMCAKIHSNGNQPLCDVTKEPVSRRSTIYAFLPLTDKLLFVHFQACGRLHIVCIYMFICLQVCVCAHVYVYT